jgi:trigger factor
MTDETPTTGTPSETDQPTGEASPSETATAIAEEGEEKSGKLKQQVDVTDIGPCKKHIKVVIERDVVDERLEEKYSKLMTDANVPGFRPGKAPRKIITKRFEKAVKEEVRGELLMASLEQMAEDHDIAPLAPPDLKPEAIEIPESGPFTYEFDVEVRPEFDLPNYKGLKLRRPVKTFTDFDVDQEERRILAPHGQLVPKPEGNAQIGDYLVVDMNSKLGDQVVGTSKEITLRIDSRLAFKDGVAEKFAAQTVGAKAGEQRVIDVTLSDNVADGRLKGSVLQSTLDVKDVKTLRLPELTHEFLHTFGVHSHEELRERIRELLNRRLEYQQRQSARDQVVEQIDAASKWELPQDLLMRQARRTLQRRIMEMRQAGMSDDEIRGRQRVLEQDVLRTTALGLKEHFVMQKIAEAEKIEINDDDIDQEIDRIASQNGESPRRVRSQLEKEDLLEALAVQLLERKSLDLILQNAEYLDVPLDKATDESVTTTEEQMVEGELKDPTAPPPEEKADETGAARVSEGATPTPTP